MASTESGAFRRFDLAEITPRHVVKRPRRIGYPPVQHRALGVERGGSLEARQPLILVKAETPTQAEIKKMLRFFRGGADREYPTAQVEIEHRVFSHLPTPR